MVVSPNLSNSVVRGARASWVCTWKAVWRGVRGVMLTQLYGTVCAGSEAPLCRGKTSESWLSNCFGRPPLFARTSSWEAYKLTAAAFDVEQSSPSASWLWSQRAAETVSKIRGEWIRNALSLKKHWHVETSSSEHSLSKCAASKSLNMQENVYSKQAIRKVKFRELAFFPQSYKHLFF